MNLSLAANAPGVGGPVRFNLSAIDLIPLLILSLRDLSGLGRGLGLDVGLGFEFGLVGFTLASGITKSLRPLLVALLQ